VQLDEGFVAWADFAAVIEDRDRSAWQRYSVHAERMYFSTGA
jgi:hypothetical protein